MDISTPDETRTLQSRTYTVNDIAAILGIGRSSACKLANSGLFKTIHGSVNSFSHFGLQALG